MFSSIVYTIFDLIFKLIANTYEPITGRADKQIMYLYIDYLVTVKNTQQAEIRSKRIENQSEMKTKSYLFSNSFLGKLDLAPHLLQFHFHFLPLQHEQLLFFLGEDIPHLLVFFSRDNCRWSNCSAGGSSSLSKRNNYYNGAVKLMLFYPDVKSRNSQKLVTMQPISEMNIAQFSEIAVIICFK